MKIENLFSNHWNVRVSDPGEEGSINHLFDTISLTLDAHIDGDKVSYHFLRKVEQEIKVKQSFTQLDELFEFLGQYVSPIALGHIGVKIGQLGLEK